MTDPRRLHTLATMVDLRLHAAQRLVNEAATITAELLDTVRSSIAGSLSQGAPMATAHALPVRAKRDITRCIAIVNGLRGRFDKQRTDPDFTELEETLRNLDARTGRRDPRLRPRRSSKRSTSAKKSAKKARARR